MSDLRLEDLRLVQCLPSCEVDHDRMVPTHHRPVTRVEVLEALGAERKWVCWALGRRCTGPRPEGPVPRTHGGCGWRWVTDDEETRFIDAIQEGR